VAFAPWTIQVRACHQAASADRGAGKHGVSGDDESFEGGGQSAYFHGWMFAVQPRISALEDPV